MRATPPVMMAKTFSDQYAVLTIADEYFEWISKSEPPNSVPPASVDKSDDMPF
jgi:hypothetical protein